MENKNYSNAFLKLRKDKVMCFLVEKFGDQIDITDRYNSNYSKAVADLIIEQQISFKAAISIKKKFNELLSDTKNILKVSDNDLKSIGISSRKVDYIKNVYEFFYQNEIDFNTLSDKDIIDTLCEIKGVGSWTAQMFLIFILFREDIFSKKDLALINSIKMNYRIKELSDRKLDKLIRSWKPFNSIASLLLWKSIEEKQFYIK